MVAGVDEVFVVLHAAANESTTQPKAALLENLMSAPTHFMRYDCARQVTGAGREQARGGVESGFTR